MVSAATAQIDTWLSACLAAERSSRFGRKYGEDGVCPGIAIDSGALWFNHPGVIAGVTTGRSSFEVNAAKRLKLR